MILNAAFRRSSGALPPVKDLAWYRGDTKTFDVRVKGVPTGRSLATLYFTATDSGGATILSQSLVIGTATGVATATLPILAGDTTDSVAVPAALSYALVAVLDDGSKATVLTGAIALATRIPVTLPSELTAVHDITVTVPAITAYSTPVTCSAVVHDSVGGIITGRAKRWSTNATPDVATINASTGALTVLADGTFDVICTVDGVSGEAVVTVALLTTPASIDAIDPVTLYEGATFQLPAPVVRNTFGTVLAGYAVTYTALDAMHDTVSATGLITGVLATSGAGPGVRITAGPVTRDVAVTVLSPAAVAMVPDFEHDPLADGYEISTRIGAWANAHFVVEEFSGGSAALKHFDSGRGDYRLHGQVTPTGALANTDRNTYSTFRGEPNWTHTIEETVRAGLQWEKYTITASAVGDEELKARNLVLTSTLESDRPVPIFAHFKVRGTAGKELWYNFQDGGYSPAWGAGTILLDGTEQEIYVETTYQGTLAQVNIDLQLHMSWNSVRAVGDAFAVLNFGAWFGRPGADRNAFKYTVPEKRPGDPEIFGNEPQVSLPLHQDYGLPLFNAFDDYLGGESERYLDAAEWIGTITRTITATPNPWNEEIPAGNPGRFLYDVHVPANGTLTLNRTFPLTQNNPTGENADVIAGSCAGRRAWVHCLVKKGAGALPAEGTLQAEITGSAVYTGTQRTIAADLGGAWYRLAFPVPIGAANTVTAFGLTIREIGGVASDFQVAAIWVERETYLQGWRDAGTFSAWRAPRKWYGVGATGTDAATTMRRRYDNLAAAFDPFHSVTFRRDFVAFDPEHVRGTDRAQIKLWDGGPNATSLNTYLLEVITDAAGVMTLQLYIQNTGSGAPAGQRGLTMSWPLTAGLLRAYAFNDLAIRVFDDPTDATLSIGEVYANGTWLDRTTPGVAVAQTAGALWSCFQLWIGMDRDLDCSWQGFMRLCGIVSGSLPARAAIEAYAAELNTRNIGSVV